MKYDCSKTLDYAHEFKRLCGAGNCEEGCVLRGLGCEADEITQAHIDRLQLWSDEHPEETMAEHFFKMFPNAPKRAGEGTPLICPGDLAWGFNPECSGSEGECLRCWSRPYIDPQIKDTV